MTAGDACMSAGCSQPVAGFCIQCGRPTCARHGGRQAGYGERCRECYGLLLEGLLNSHYRAGKLAEAVQLLEGAGEGGQPPERSFYQALALAASGELDAAFSRLKGLLGGGSSEWLERQVRQAAATILSARAARRLQSQQSLEAADDLRQAVGFAPEETKTSAELLAALGHNLAYEYYRAGRLPEALGEWEAIQQRSPLDLSVTHYLAVLYYRLASELEEKKPVEAERFWKLAIAHWAVILVNPSFWKQWGAVRSKAVGKVTEAILSEVRQSAVDRLQAGFRDYRARYLKEKHPKHAERQFEYEVAFTRERHAARAMLEVLSQGGPRADDPGFACGPLMLERLRSLEGGAGYAADLAAKAESDQKVRSYFSPLGHFFVLVEEMKRYREAQPGLEAWLKHNPQDHTAQDLFVSCLTELGKELLEAKDPKSAAELLEKAAKLNLRRSTTLPLLSKAAVAYTTLTLQEESGLYKTEEDVKNRQVLLKARGIVNPAVTLLERLKREHQLSDPDFTAQLAQAYYRRGFISNQLNEFQSSLDDLNRVLQIDPNHAAANENYITILMNRAFDYLNASSPERAYELLTQAVQRSPEKIDPQQAAQIVFSLGIKHANDAISAHNYNPYLNVCDQLRNALAEVDEAIRLDPANAHYRTERNNINQVFRQLNC